MECIDECWICKKKITRGAAKMLFNKKSSRFEEVCSGCFIIKTKKKGRRLKEKP
jgi:hypothetical protein